MFSVGQRVWHVGGQRTGIVLECDGGRVFIEQDNGAELDFPASQLTATAPAGGAHGAGSQRAAQPGRAAAQGTAGRALRASDITPEHSRVLGMVPVRTLQAVAAVFDGRVSGGKFSALDVAGKLNAIAEITAVPYRTMHAYSDRPGELGLLMGKGLADSRRAG